MARKPKNNSTPETENHNPIVAYEDPGDDALGVLPFRHPWDLQEYEDKEEYSLFRQFRDMGSIRGIDSLARLTGLDECLLRGMMVRLRWEVRAFAYDQYIEGILSRHTQKRLEAETRETSQSILEVIGRDVRTLKQMVSMEAIGDVTPQQVVSRLLALTNVYDRLHKSGIFNNDNDKSRNVQIHFTTGMPESMISIEAEAHEVERLGAQTPRTGIEMAMRKSEDAETKGDEGDE